MKQQLPELGASCSAGRPLGELVQFLDSLRRPIKASAREAGPYPYFGANGQVDSVAGFLFDEKLVLLAEDGGYFDDPNRPISYLVDGKCWVNNHAHVLRVGQMLVPEYLNYQLAYADVKPYLSGTTRAKLTKSDASRIPIVCPPLPEQRRIVDLLTRAEGIVRLRREAAAKAAELIPALFIHHFGDPATNPMGWTLLPFGAVGSLDRGKSRHRPRDARELYDGPYPFIQTGDVANSRGVIRAYSSTYSELGLAQSRLWRSGTLCITIAANIAKTGVLAFDACFPDSVVGFLPGSQVRTEFVQAWLGFLQPTLEANAPQAAQKNINLEILRALPVPVPPLNLQDKFVAQAQAAVGIASQQTAALTKAQATFDALLAQAFAPA